MWTEKSVPLVESAAVTVAEVRVLEIPVSTSVKEGAKIIGVSPATLYQLLAANEIESYVINRKRRLVGASLEKLIRRRTQSTYGPTCVVGRKKTA